MKKNAHIILTALIFSIVLWGSVSLSNDYYATINVPLKLINFPKGYTSSTKLPQDISVRVKGKGWKLIALNLGSESDYYISAKKESGKQTVFLSNYLSDNQWLSSGLEVINITPDTLSFLLEKVISKKVKIIPDLNLKFKSGYGLATNIVIKPETTTVSGPVSEVHRMKNVHTKNILLNNLDDKTFKLVELQDFPGVSYSNSKVSVYLNVQKIVDKNISDVPVNVVDVPKDRTVVLLPNKIEISVRGGINILAKLTKDDFNSFVNYRDVVLDTLGSIVPKIILPENTLLLYSKPERLRYVIKKFN